MDPLEPACIHQLLKGPVVIRLRRTQKVINNNNEKEGIGNLLCDLCGALLNCIIGGGGGNRHSHVVLSSVEQEVLKYLLGKEGHYPTSSVLQSHPVLSTLCPSCGDGVCSLLSLGRRVRRMRKELKDKTQTLKNILRWKAERKMNSVKRERDTDKDNVEEEEEEVPIGEGSIKGEVEDDDVDGHWEQGDQDEDQGSQDLGQNEEDNNVNEPNAVEVSNTGSGEEKDKPTQKRRRNGKESSMMTDDNESDSKESLALATLFLHNSSPKEDQEQTKDVAKPDNSEYDPESSLPQPPLTTRKRKSKTAALEMIKKTDLGVETPAEEENNYESHCEEEFYSSAESDSDSCSFAGEDDDDELETKVKLKKDGKLQDKGESVGSRCELCNINFKLKRGYRDHLVSITHRTKAQEAGILLDIPKPVKIRKKDHGHTYLNGVEELNVEGPPFTCICENSFDDIRMRNYHFQVTHPLKNYLECVPCGKQTNGKKGFLYHIQTYDHKKRILEKEGITDAIEIEECLRPSFICETCGKGFHNELTYGLHKKVHAPRERNLACKECGKKFRTKNNLRSHLKIHFPDCVCEICGRIFPENYLLRNHILSVHEMHAYKCQHCDKGFKRNMHLKEHIVNYHSNGHGEGLFCCPQCTEKFTTIKARKLHERSVHKLQQNHKCHECGMMFPENNKLRTHMVKHTGVTCSKCNKKFTSSTGLKNHQATICGDNEEKLEAARRKKREEMARFRSKKSYKCSECGECFGQKPQLTCHMKKDHGQD